MTSAPLERPVSPWARDLFTALAALRASSHALGRPENDRHWRTVYRCLRPLVSRDGPDGDDECQEIVLKLALSLGSMRADSPVRAVAWLRSVCLHARIDRVRTRVKHRALTLDDPDREIAVAAPESEHREELELVLAAFEAAVAHELALSAMSEESRTLATLQARATIRRLVLHESTHQIARALGRTVSADLISKWIERGRAVVLQTIAIMREEDPDAAELYEVLAELAATRRSDAGRARPERRRPRPEPN